jgi:hypothetical protein
MNYDDPMNAHRPRPSSSSFVLDAPPAWLILFPFVASGLEPVETAILQKADQQF